MNYKLRIQCFKVTPYALDEQLFLDVEQIIPMKDSEEYIIGMADKTQEDIDSQEVLKARHYKRLEFWKMLLKEMNSRSFMYQNVNPTKDHWLSAGGGVSGVGFNFVVSRNYARTEVIIARAITEENKFIYDELMKIKDSIEAEFGSALEWERLDDKKSSRIKHELREVSFYNRDDWEKMIEFMVDGMIRMEKALKEPLRKINQRLRAKEG